MNLVLLHGYTQNGRVLRADLAPLVDRLEGFEVVAPDGPFACDPADLGRLGPALGVEAERAPHLTWWRATDDGAVYHGWESARDALDALIRPLAGRVPRTPPARSSPPEPLFSSPAPPAAGASVGVLGFSQGAMLAACAAAWSARGELPPLAFVVLVAGRVPRAAALRPLFLDPVPVPSLHVWGARDPMAAMAPELAARFVDPEVLGWEGPHVVPTRGTAGEALLAFLRRRREVDADSSPPRHARG